MDMERYGDYTEYEDDIPKSKSKVALTLKILIALVCFSVIGVLVFRMFLFSYYPENMKTLYFNDKLTALYNEKGGDIDVKTQDLRAVYDDPDVAIFICDNLFVISEAEQLQITVRMNKSALDDIEKELSLTGLDPAAEGFLSFKLACYSDEIGGEAYIDGVSVSIVAYEAKLMYHYYKLVCDGVKLGGINEPGWIRLDAFIAGSDEKFRGVYIYENNESYSVFKDYELSEEERP